MDLCWPPLNLKEVSGYLDLLFIEREDRAGLPSNYRALAYGYSMKVGYQESLALTINPNRWEISSIGLVGTATLSSIFPQGTMRSS